MAAYIPLATKYRPKRFADVVGQDIVVKIITSGMMKNRLGAAMLFSGTRGVGKTTIARILAVAFRCENSDPEPCEKCSYCLESKSNSQIDIIEIDAASNTSVDDVREIIESCRYKPTTGKYKVFIIDEVHMLSKSAFNALLKTLEEPPEHVKFLLATTEMHKIPETILSRVLKFDLKKVDSGLITQYLSSICNQENITVEFDVLGVIAKAAEGSIRDSLSILDQAINMSMSDQISMSDIREMLNYSNDSDIVDLLRMLAAGNIKSAIEKYREIIRGDACCEKIASVLLDYVYAATCIKTNIEIANGVVSADIASKLCAATKNVSIPALSRIWQMLLLGINEMKTCDRQEIVLEMLIVRLVYASGLPDLHEIINSVSFGVDDKAEVVEAKAETMKAKVVTEDTGFTNASLSDRALQMFPNAIVS